jgi:uncharacterized protein (TIGR02270 family)
VYLLAVLSDPSAERVLETGVQSISSYHVRAFARGLGRAACVPALQALWERVKGGSATSRAIVLEALAFCGEAPDLEWKALLDDSDPDLRAAAAASLRFAPATLIDVYAEVATDSPDPRVRNLAITSGIAAGRSAYFRRCLKCVRDPDPHSGPLLLLAAALGSKSDIARVIEALAVPALSRDALWALGFAGTREAIEACLAHMRAGGDNRVAAEAFCAITGLDLAASKLVDHSDDGSMTDERAETHDDLEEPYEAEDLDASLLPAADSFLSRPDVRGIEQWWSVNQSHFAPEARYIGGQLKTMNTLRAALELGPTRRRDALALELSARTAGGCAVQTYAFCRHQRQVLNRVAALAPNTLRNAASALGVQRLGEAA